MRADFGITWVSTGYYRVQLGSVGKKPFYSEFISAKRAGGKRKAKELAREKRDKVLAKPEFKKHYKHRVGYSKLRVSRSGSSTPVTGLTLTHGKRFSGHAVLGSPAILVNYKGGYVGRFGLKKYGIKKAFLLAVRARRQCEGRRYSEKEAMTLYEEWIQRDYVKRLIVECEL